MDRNVTVSFSMRSLLLIGLALAVLFLAYVVKDIIILFALAYILASAMRPLVNAMHKLKVPKVVSLLIIFFGLLAGLVFTFRVLVPPIIDQVDNLASNQQYLIGRAREYIHLLPDSVEGNVIVYLNTLPNKLQAFFLSGSTFEGVLGFFAGFGGLLTVLIVSFYMLLENSSFEKFIVYLWPGQTREKERMQKAFRQVDLKVSMWVRGQLILSLSIGLLTYIGLSLLGVPYALILAIIAAFTELIPMAGPFIGAIPAIIFAFLESPILALWVMMLATGIQQFENHVLVPQVMKRAVGLSAVSVIFSILVGAKLFGIMGAIVAVPVAASIKVLSESLTKRS